MNFAALPPAGRDLRDNPFIRHQISLY